MKVVTYHERLPLLESHDSLITRPKLGHVTNLKVISTFSRLIATKLGKALTSGKLFITPMSQPSPTSCYTLLKIIIVVATFVMSKHNPNSAAIKLFIFFHNVPFLSISVFVKHSFQFIPCCHWFIYCLSYQGLRGKRTLPFYCCYYYY